MAKLLTTKHLKLQSNAIKDYLETEDWQLDGDTFTYGKVFKNLSPYVKIGGVNSAPTLEGKSVTIPASVFDSDTTITLSGAGYEFFFDSAFNLQLEGKNSTINGSNGNDSILGNGNNHLYYFGGGNDSICGFNLNGDTIGVKDVLTTITDSVDGTNTTLTFANGTDTSSVVLENITSGNIDILIDRYAESYEIGNGLISDLAINVESGVTITSIPTGKSTLVNLADNASISGLHNVDNGGDNATIISSTTADSVYNSGDNASIDAQAANDFIYSCGNNVSIHAGAGNDTIVINSTQGNSGNTIRAGTGNDSIFSSNGGQTYVFAENEGTNYIYGFSSGDKIQIEGVTPANSESKLNFSTTREGVVLTIGTGTKMTTVTIKGEMIIPTAASNYNDDDWVAYQTEKSNYNAIKGGTVITYTIEDGNGGFLTNTYVVEKLILGTNASDFTSSTTTNGAGNLIAQAGEHDNYTIDAKAGNDSIQSLAEGVSISGGLGNDTIIMVDDVDDIYQKAVSNTVMAGKGNDSIVSSGIGNLFQYNNGDGDDTILNFSADDTLQIIGATYTPSINANDEFTILVGSGYIILKGADVRGGQTLNVSDTEKTTVTVEKKSYGTNAADNKEIGSTLEGYEYFALNGNDTITITSDAKTVTINSGSGHDVINIQGGSNVVVKPGYSNDTINAEYGVTEGVLYVFDTYDQGENVINGLKANDTIQIDITHNDSQITITSALYDSYDSDGYLILSLSDNLTSIKLKEAYLENGETKYRQMGDAANRINGTAVQSFNLIYGSDTNNVQTFKIPFWTKITDTLPHVFNSDYSNVIFIGNSDANKIQISGANSVSIDGGEGNDEINIAAGEEITITPGKGNDIITLATSGHIVNYAYGDGNDTIYGWSESDTLVISGFEASKFKTSMTGANGDTFAVLLGSNSITFPDIQPDSIIKVEGSVVSDTTYTGSYSDIVYDSDVQCLKVTVPRLILGTDNADTLFNNSDNFTINAAKSSDSITNTGNNVSIDGGAGNDSITSSGNYVSISAGAGNDSIFVVGGSYSTIQADAGDDIVSLGTGAVNNTIYGGVGKDTIFGNDLANTFVYNSGDGNDTLYGFNSSDTLKIPADLLYTDTKVVNGVTETVVGGISYTFKGLVLKLKDGKTITLKGKKINPNGENTQDNFKFLNSSDTFIITTGDNPEDTIRAYVDNVKVVTEKVELVNDDDNYSIQGSYIADTITNSGDNVTITALKGMDTITNSGDFVSINAGAGNDFIINSGNGVSVLTSFGNDTVSLDGASNTSIILDGDMLDYDGGIEYYYGFNQDSDTVVIVPSISAVSSTVLDGGSDTQLILTNGSYHTSLNFYGISSGTIRIKIADNEVQLFNIS